MATKKVILSDSDGQPLDETIVLLRRIAKLLESSATVDGINQQRVSVGNVPQFLGYNSTSTGTTNYPSNVGPIVAPTTTYWTGVWLGPVDQRWEIADRARIAADTIRTKLVFS